MLVALIEQRGEIVTREELRERLWPGNVVVEFDNGLNNAVNKLRAALADSATEPHFIETVGRRGYRFVATLAEDVESPAPPASAAPNVAPRAPVPAAPSPSMARSRPRVRWAAAAVAVVVLVAAAAAVLDWRPLSAPEIRSLAVLPLENLSSDGDQEYFSDGMTDALISQLAGIRSLRIISRQSVMRYKRSVVPMPTIAAELGVDAVIEGTVLRSANRVRVTVQPIHAHSDRTLLERAVRRRARRRACAPGRDRSIRRARGACDGHTARNRAARGRRAD